MSARALPRRGAVTRPILPEWGAETLVYGSPGETMNRFGYTGLSQRGGTSVDEQTLYGRIEARVGLQDGAVARRRVELGSAADASVW